MNEVHEQTGSQSFAVRRERTAGGILDEAERVIGRSGLVTLRARDLAEVASCSVGFIYKLFPGGLDEIVLAVNARTLTLLDAHLAAAIGALPPASNPAAATEQLVVLALGYLDFARDHTLRWRALFDHAMPEGAAVPEEHLRMHEGLFVHIDGPLRLLCPELAADERGLLSHSLFSAVHGVVTLGLDERFVAVPLPHLRRQLALVVRAAGLGLTGTK